MDTEFIAEECDDLHNALADLYENGANDEDEARVQYHLSRIEEFFEGLKNAHATK